MNKTISLLDLPSEILEKIILQVSDEKDIYLHPFININWHVPAGLNVCVDPYKCKRQRTDRPGVKTFNCNWNRFRNDNPNFNVLLGTLCILSRVSKGMYDEINNNRIYWRNMYIRDCRQGRPYKYDNRNYKLRYLQKIYEYYYVILQQSKRKFEKISNKLFVNVNNAEIYLQTMREAVLNDAIDLPNQIYHIPDLKRIFTEWSWSNRDAAAIFRRENPDNDIQNTYKNIKLEEIVNFRRKCLEEIILYKKKIAEDTPKLQKFEDILNGLKMLGCK